MLYLISYLVLINLVGFCLMEIDKQKAKKRKWRISEKSLLGVAILFGAYGAYGGMKFFRHKTKHKLFTISLPLLVLGQTVFLVWAWLRWG